MKKEIRIFLIVLFCIMLIAIRAFVEPFFYDPLILYFKNDYLHKAIPKVNTSQYFVHIFLRYFLNTSLSLAIIYLIFNNLKTLLFSLKFYIIAFIILNFLLFIMLKFSIFDSYIFIFYVRRFLIHPLFLLILIPAFYYQKIIAKEN
jgi:exosortase F-associated protein